MTDQQHEIDDALDSSSYSGTFRWKATKALPNMPPISRLSSLLEPFQINLESGWRGYFFSRGQYSSFPGAIDDSDDAGDYLVNYALKNLCLVDCMSFPLSIAYILSRCGAFDGSKTLGKYQTINILCTGCAQRAEERILRQTNAFEELIFLLPGFVQINLWLIGPEMSETVSHFREFSYNNRSITSNIFQGNMGQFFRQHSSMLSGNTVVFGFNCGFGNFENPMPHKFDLLLSWINDLFFLTGTQLPVYFTCANHYADVSGEITIMHHILGAILTLLPQENPFSFASTLIPPEEEWRKKGKSSQPTEFSRGNSYFYGVQHCDKQRRKRIALNGDDKSRILGSLISFLTQKIEVDDLMKTLTSATLNFERREGQPLTSLPTESTSKATGTASSAPTVPTTTAAAKAKAKATATKAGTAKTPAVVASQASQVSKPSSKDTPSVTSSVSTVKATEEAKETTDDHTTTTTTTDTSITAAMPSSIRDDFFANVSKLGQSTIVNTNGGGPGSIRSGYSSKSSSPGTGLRNESKLLATIMAAKSGSGSGSVTNSSTSSSQGLSPAVSPCPSTTTSLCGDGTATSTATDIAPTPVSTTGPLSPVATISSASTTLAADPLMVPTDTSSISPTTKNLLEPVAVAASSQLTTTAAAAVLGPTTAGIPVEEDASLVHIEQSILPETRQLQILITSPLSPPHQPLQVNTLALNLHTSGQRLRISTPQSNTSSMMYYSREIMLFHPVKCTPRDLEAKYSKKKNVLTVKIALAQEPDVIDLGYPVGSV